MSRIDTTESKIHEGDCKELLRTIKPCSIDLIVTDPPYGINLNVKQTNNDTRFSRFNPIEGDDVIDTSTLMEYYRVLRPNGALYLFTRWDVYPEWLVGVENFFTVKSCIVWDKMHHGLGPQDRTYVGQHEFVIFAIKGDHRLQGRWSSNILRYPRVDSKKMQHPNQKPLSILKLFIEKSSNRGDIVLDPYAGSGTTVIAAVQMNRVGIGFEVVPEYAKIAQSRVEEETKQTDMFADYREEDNGDSASKEHVSCSEGVG